MMLRSHDDDDDHVRKTLDEAEDDAVEEFFTRCPRLTPPRGRGANETHLRGARGAVPRGGDDDG